MKKEKEKHGKVVTIVKETLSNIKKFRYFTVSICLFSYLFGMIQPYYLGKLLDQAELPASVIITLCGIILVLLISNFLLDWLQNFLWFKMIYKGIYLVRKRLFKEVIQQNFEYITKNQCGDIVNRLINDSAVYAEKQLITMPMLLINVSTLVVIFSVIAFLNIYIALILFVISILYFASYRFFDKKLRKYALLSGGDSSKMMHTANRLYEGIPTIKLFGKEKFFEKKFENSVFDKYKSSVELRRWQSLAQSLSSFIAGLLPVVSIMAGIYFVSIGKCTMGAIFTIFTIFTYTGYIGEPIRNLTDFNIKVQEGKAMEKRLEFLIPEQKEEEKKKELEVIETLQIDQFCYEYENGTGVKNINISLKQGDCLGIVGPSGTGKSTCLKLLLGQLHPTEGSIKVNGERLENYSSYLRKLAILPQEIFLFEDSVKENIVFGRNYDNKELETLLHRLEIEKFYGRDMNELSGGEKKRVGICRALLGFQNVLILDEPTSDVDMEMEKKMVKLVGEYVTKKNGILIVITHRPEILKICNKTLQL